MSFIEVKGASDEPAFVKAESVVAVEFYEPRGNLRVYTSSGRTYYSDDKPEAFLEKVDPNAEQIAKWREELKQLAAKEPTLFDKPETGGKKRG